MDDSAFSRVIRGAQMKAVNFSKAVGSSLMSAAKWGSIAALSLAGIAAFQGLKHGILNAAELEKERTSLTVLLGTVKKADDLLGDVLKFEAQTPFTFPELMKSTRMLVAFGYETKAILPSLSKMGDLASGMGVPLDEMAYLFGHARAQGQLFARTLNQFTMRGIPMVQALAAVMKVPEEEIHKLVESGKVGFKELTQALNYLTEEGGKFHGIMEKQSHATLGLFSTLRSRIFLVGAAFGAPINDRLRPILEAVISQMPKIITMAGHAGNAFGGMVDVIAGAIIKPGMAFKALWAGAAANAVGAMAQMLNLPKMFIARSVGMFNFWRSNWGDMIGLAGEFGAAILETAGESLAEVAKLAIGGFDSASVGFTKSLHGAIDWFQGAWDKTVLTAGDFGRRIFNSEIFRYASEALNATAEGMIAMLKSGFMRLPGAIYAGMIDVVAGFFTAMNIGSAKMTNYFSQGFQKAIYDPIKNGALYLLGAVTKIGEVLWNAVTGGWDAAVTLSKAAFKSLEGGPDKENPKKYNEDWGVEFQRNKEIFSAMFPKIGDSTKRMAEDAKEESAKATAHFETAMEALNKTGSAIEKKAVQVGAKIGLINLATLPPEIRRAQESGPASSFHAQSVAPAMKAASVNASASSAQSTAPVSPAKLQSVAPGIKEAHRIADKYATPGAGKARVSYPEKTPPPIYDLEAEMERSTLQAQGIDPDVFASQRDSARMAEAASNMPPTAETAQGEGVTPPMMIAGQPAGEGSQQPGFPPPMMTPKNQAATTQSFAPNLKAAQPEKPKRETRNNETEVNVDGIWRTREEEAKIDKGATFGTGFNADYSGGYREITPPADIFPEVPPPALPPLPGSPSPAIAENKTPLPSANATAFPSLPASGVGGRIKADQEWAAAKRSQAVPTPATGEKKGGSSLPDFSGAQSDAKAATGLFGSAMAVLANAGQTIKDKIMDGASKFEKTPGLGDAAKRLKADSDMRTASLAETGKTKLQSFVPNISKENADKKKWGKLATFASFSSQNGLTDNRKDAPKSMLSTGLFGQGGFFDKSFIGPRLSQNHSTALSNPGLERGLGGGAFNRVRQGDAARRKADVEAAKIAPEGLEAVAKNTSDLLAVTKEAWL